MKKMVFILLALALLTGISLHPAMVEEVSAATTYYVATTGDDNNPGTYSQPFATLQKAADTVIAGDIVYLRGGTYYPTSRIDFDTSGTQSDPITFAGYQNEKVIIDGSNVPKEDVDWMGLLRIRADWLVLEKFDVKDSASQGIHLKESADNNIFRNINSYNNGGSGFMSFGYSNQFLNVIAHHNSDADDPRYEGNNADGISLSRGGNNIVRNSLIYENSDDGLDTWESTGNIIEDCIVHDNGYGDRGDGVGFKLGVTGGNTVRRCVAYNNVWGFSNNGGVNNTIDHCTAYNNERNSFVSTFSYFTHERYTSNTNTYTNNIGDKSVSIDLPDKLIQYNNSWNLGITDPGFISTNPSSSDFLRLTEDSPCRGAASDGNDIGAFQYD